jgi:hypothetical protein
MNTVPTCEFAGGARLKIVTAAGGNQGEPFPTAAGIPLSFPRTPFLLLSGPTKGPLRGPQPPNAQTEASNRGSAQAQTETMAEAGTAASEDRSLRAP